MNCGSELGYTLSTNGCTCDQGSYREFVGLWVFVHFHISVEVNSADSWL